MKKIFNILLLAVFTLSVFTACEKDDDSNPVLKRAYHLFTQPAAICSQQYLRLEKCEDSGIDLFTARLWFSGCYNIQCSGGA